MIPPHQPSFQMVISLDDDTELDIQSQPGPVTEGIREPNNQANNPTQIPAEVQPNDNQQSPTNTSSTFTIELDDSQGPQHQHQIQHFTRMLDLVDSQISQMRRIGRLTEVIRESNNQTQIPQYDTNMPAEVQPNGNQQSPTNISSRSTIELDNSQGLQRQHQSHTHLDRILDLLDHQIIQMNRIASLLK